ncbi:F0F1 ATP synthase subunit B [Parazoarcus communis]|uniref:ATP synthase subunit b n=1 Tax=Parazoarcus communis TaxID=41977 RepID=A0A2U8GQ86_9RHOO|nr:F0F1 ATP synthase subunit delta [Parazoarcus communis]AWI74655.1 F0F1 ATP synthase subunit B [Parazoarcus communis]
MLIDWFTVGAQVLNFLILVWLLKRYLYQPILDAIDAREQRIAEELAQADATRVEAEQARERFQAKCDDFDRQRDELLRQAGADADAERKRLLDVARKSATDLSAQRQASLMKESDGLSQALRSRTQQEVFAIARKTLADLTGASLEARIVDVLVQRMADVSADDRAALVKAFQASTAPVTVRSAFELPHAEREALKAAIKNSLGVTPSLQFETAPEVIGGIEIASAGHQLDWSINGYLDTLQAAVNELIKVAVPVAAAPDVEPGVEADTAQDTDEPAPAAEARGDAN